MEPLNSFLSLDDIKTFSGCVAIVGLVVQFTKNGLDKIIKIPTQLYTYIISLLILIVTDMFVSPCTAENFLLDFLDAILVSLAANGAYHLFSNTLNEKV